MNLLARLLHAYTGQHIKINYIFLYTKTKINLKTVPFIIASKNIKYS